MAKYLLHASQISDQALDDTFTTRANELLAPFTAATIPAEVVANLLKQAMRDAHQAALDGATYQWRVESKDVELPQHGWRGGNIYPSEREARESAERDMRDAQLNGDEEGTSRFRIVPMTLIEGPPLSVRYIRPTTYQARINAKGSRHATVAVELVKPGADLDAPYPRIEAALAALNLGVTHDHPDAVEQADKILEASGWTALVGWRDLPDGDKYTFVVKS